MRTVVKSRRDLFGPLIGERLWPSDRYGWLKCAFIGDRTLAVDSETVVVVDEASMLGTPELTKLLACATLGRAKTVLVGDACQLYPVKARGGMFESTLRRPAVEPAPRRGVALARAHQHATNVTRDTGGYRFADYVKVGLPMLLLTMLVTVALAKVIYLPGYST